MESKRLILAIVCSILVIIIWRHVSEMIWPTPPEAGGPGAPGVVQQGPIDGPEGQVFTGQEQRPVGAVAPVVDVPVDPQALYVQAAENRDDNIPLGNSQVGNGYRMKLMLTNRGAGIVCADLTEYAESVIDPEGRYRLLNKLEVADSVYYSLQSQKVVVNWDSRSEQVALGEVNWNWRTSQGQGYQEVDFWIRCSDSSGPVLEIHKIYRLAKGSRDVELSITLKELTNKQAYLCRGGEHLQQLITQRKARQQNGNM